MWEHQTRLTNAYIMTAYPHQYSIRYRDQPEENYFAIPVMRPH